LLQRWRLRRSLLCLLAFIMCVVCLRNREKKSCGGTRRRRDCWELGRGPNPYRLPKILIALL
jgi:hypothetical protein